MNIKNALTKEVQFLTEQGRASFRFAEKKGDLSIDSAYRERLSLLINSYKRIIQSLNEET
jgi:hypothetical protein